MRAIDADRLLQVLEINFGHTGGADVMRQLIDAQPTITHSNEWISTEDRLPEDSECWGTYIVTVNRSHWPTSSYGICDAPYDEQLVASAQYDSKQKIWHLPWDEQLNALIQADDAPLNGDFVTHWMPPPKPPKGAADVAENATSSEHGTWHEWITGRFGAVR